MKWYADNVEKKLRYDYDLNKNSVVLDVGGYEGDFAAEIFARYQPEIYIFEPVNKYVNILHTRFRKNEHIHVIPHGLGDKTREITMYVMEEASSYNRSSSAHKKGSEEKISIIGIKEFMDKNRPQKIHLIKINIEGAEYDLLDEMIANKYHLMCENIQIQFHDFYPNYQERYDKIVQHLKQTHQQTYCYSFVWENWKLK